MNVTELARILKISPQELRDILPQVGFHIGQKAIKIDNRTAQRIIKDWAEIKRKYDKIKQDEKEEVDGVEEEIQVKKAITIPNFITVRDFSTLAQLPVNKVLTELMKNGIFASINEKIDFDTAVIIGEDLNLEVSLNPEEGKEGDNKEQNKLDEVLKKEDKNKLTSRPPVIVVMGHVDHGKTKLLDAVRKTDVVAGEAGGITQHIGAYQVHRKEKIVTFIDTPGHEAFTAMRSRGARVADIAILVVAADDGVKPQTVEAFQIIKAAKIPFIVAINKIDKEAADVNKVKQELSTQLKITPEDWGGKTVCAPVSAITKDGIEDLLDMILLTAEMEEENIRASKEALAIGTVIESHIDKGAGPVATILVQNGTLRIGDQLCFDNKIYGKTRALKDYKGDNLDEALPSVPVQVLGLKILPEVGDVLEVGQGERIKTRKNKTQDSVISQLSNQVGDEEEGRSIKRINLIIKSDVLGSAEAVEESLEKINTEKVKVKIVHKGLGNIGEGDIKRAEDSKAQLLGFNVKVQPQVEDLVREKGIKVNIFNIIYDLIEYVKNEMQTLVEPETKRVDLGKLKVLVIFRTENDSQIIGGKVLSGQVVKDSLIEVLREKQVIANGKLIKLQAGKQDVDLVETNQECGLQYEGKPIIVEGDVLQFYKEERTIKKI